MRILYSWLKEFVDLSATADELAQLLTERGIEAESIFAFASLVKEYSFGQVQRKVSESDGLSTYEVSLGGKVVQASSKCRDIPEGFCVLVSKSGQCIPTLEELGISSVKFPLVKPSTMREEEVFSDAVIEFAVVSNRGDLLSHLGMAREVCAALGHKLKFPQLAEAGGDGGEAPSITLENVDLCPRYVGAYLDVKGLRTSPDWLVYRLIACGISPINNIVDLTNYVLFELGQPLHAFDRRLLSGGIIVRNARNGERFTAINHVEYTLDESMLVIADEEKAVAIGGVMGGLNTEISVSTEAILLESAFFTPINIRVECKKLGLMSESSLRFGRGTDPEMPPVGAKRFIYLAERIGAASFVPGSFVDKNLYQPARPTIAFTISFINRFLGTHLNERDVIENLQKIGIKVEKEMRESKKAEVQGEVVEKVQECKHSASETAQSVDEKSSCVFVAIPPSWRHDLKIKEDIAEEALRLNLFDSLEPKSVIAPLKSGRLDEYLAFEEKVEELTTSLGLQQVSTYIFIADEKAELYRLDKNRLVQVKNPDTSDQAYLVPTLLPSLVEVVKTNLRKRLDPPPFFEIGRAYSSEPFDSAFAYELSANDQKFYEQHCLGVIYGEGFSSPGLIRHSFTHKHPFYLLKGFAQELLERLGVQGIKYKPKSYPFLEKGKSFELIICQAETRDKPVGFIGEVAENIRRQEDIELPLAYLELSLDALLELASEMTIFQTYSQYPSIIRDVALLLPLSMPSAKVEQILQRVCGDNLASIHPFDVYIGKQVQAGKKSVAYRLTFQRMDRTLTHGEVDKVLLDSLKVLYDELGVVLRDYEKVFSQAKLSQELKDVYSKTS